MPTVRPGVITRLSDREGILGCINENDGSGYIHAILESYHPGYSHVKSDNYRTNLAKSVRIGALPSILRSRYGAEPLCRKGCSEAHSLFNRAIAFGSPLPQVLLRDYAEYLQVPYRLYDADLQLIEEYQIPGSKTKGEIACNIISVSEDEHHLLVSLLPPKRGDSETRVRFRVLNEARR